MGGSSDDYTLQKRKCNHTTLSSSQVKKNWRACVLWDDERSMLVRGTQTRHAPLYAIIPVLDSPHIYMVGATTCSSGILCITDLTNRSGASRRSLGIFFSKLNVQTSPSSDSSNIPKTAFLSTSPLLGRLEGIEPSSPGPQPGALPLSYSRHITLYCKRWLALYHKFW